MVKDYGDGRKLYADPMDYLDSMKASARADEIYAPATEELVA